MGHNVETQDSEIPNPTCRYSKEICENHFYDSWNLYLEQRYRKEGPINDKKRLLKILFYRELFPFYESLPLTPSGKGVGAISFIQTLFKNLQMP